MFRKSYIRCVLATGYETINFIKCLKEYRATRDHNKNIKSRNKRREHYYSKLEKVKGRKKEFLLPKPKNREYLIRFSVR